MEDPIDQIWALIEAEEFEEALSLALFVEKDFQEDDFFFYLKGCAEFQCAKIEEALLSFERAVSLNPSEPSYCSDLGWVLYIQERFEESLWFLQKAFDADPSDFISLERKALVLIALSRLEDAKSILHSMIQTLDEEPARLWYYLGEIYFSEEEHEAALECYENALQIEDGFMEARLSKAACYEEVEEDEKAAEIYEAVAEELEEAGDITDILISAGACRLRCKQYEKAWRAWIHAHQIEPENPVVLNNLGLVCLEVGEYDRGFNFLKTALSLEEGFEVYYNLSRCLFLQKRFEAALVWSEKAEELVQEEFQKGALYFLSGRIFFQMEIYDRALVCLLESVHIGVDDSEVYLLCLESAEKIQKIEEVFEVLRGRRPSTRNLFYSLILFLLSRNSLETALEVIRDGLKKFSKEPWFLYFRASVYALLGDINKSLDSIRKLFAVDESFKSKVRGGECFLAFREDPRFKKLVNRDSDFTGVVL